MTQVNVCSGDITQYEADGLITAINSGGLWFGGIDGAIRGAAGDMFHSQVQAAMPLTDGQVVFARAMDGHRGKFSNVLFMIDDLQRPLREILGAGLREADKRNLSSVSVPMIRTGVMAGAYEPSVQAALDEMVNAISDFVASRPTSVKQISFIVYDDAYSERYLSETLAMT